MTRKHYKLLAAEIKSYIEADPSVTFSVAFDEFVHGLCFILKGDNPNFNEQKFMDACGLGVDNRF